MKILLLTASPGPQSAFDRRIEEIRRRLEEKGEQPVLIDLSRHPLQFCTGCFNCWWKHPGKCIHSDAMERIYPEIITSDLVVLASPLSGGLPSWRIKALQDRLIPLLHPYIELRQGECHHRKRYKGYPEIALLIEKEPDTGAEDLSILEELYRRFALNFHSGLKVTADLDMTNEEICHELCAS